MPSDFSDGRYQVKRLLGQGSKKTVYLAHDTVLDRDVAFALIKTESDEVSGGRIVREAQAMGRLSAHPNIVTVYDLGEHDGQPFMVTELMAAGDLGTLIEEAPDHRIPLTQSVEIARSVCLGLEFAHSHGIVHRDLKPGNVWLAGDGTAKIGDFGLAFSVDRPRLTREAMMVGTLYYMPPEQATGRGVTAKSDLYSLGVMLYEMVTGTPPFLGDDMVTIIGQHVNNTPIPPTWHNPACPQPLEDVIVGLLEKSPEARPQSAAVVQVALDAIRNSMSTAATAPVDPRNSIEQVALTVAVERPDLSQSAAPDGTVTVLFSDIEASTTMTERLGDQKAQEVLRSHNSIIRSQVATHGGFEVKSLGDGFMLAFSSARRAVQCAIAIQRSLASYNEGHQGQPLRVRIGLHAGEVVREVDDFFGKNVILASRIASQAHGAQILVSALLKELTDSSGDLRFGEGHDVKLKGLTGTTRVFPVIWDQTGTLDGGGDPAGFRGLSRLIPRGVRSRLGKAIIGLAAVTGLVAAGLWISGSFSGPGAPPDPGLLALAPGSMTRWVSPDGTVTVTAPAGAVETPVTLAYRAVPAEQIPELPEGFLASQRAFDLSAEGPQADAEGSFSFSKPITLSVALGAGDAGLAGGVRANVVIQHFKSGIGWSPLPTEVDFQAATALSETDSLSVFALTIRKPPPTPTPAPVPTATTIPIPAPSPTSMPTPTLGPTPTLEPTPTRVPTPTAARALQPGGGREPSVWFGEVFTNKATLSLERATILNPEKPETRFYGRFQANLELLGFQVTRGLTTPTREELSTFDIIVIPAPNSPSLTEQVVDTVLAVVAEEGKGVLVIAEPGGGRQGPVNRLTQQFGVRAYGGVVTSLADSGSPGVFGITNIDKSHPVTRGIDEITASGMAPVVVTRPQLEAQVRVLVQAAEGVEAAEGPSAGPFAHTVAIEYGEGRVLIIADSFPFVGQTSRAEKQLASNAIGWLAETAGPAPAPPSIPTATPAPAPTPTAVPQYVLNTGITPEGQGTIEVLPEGENHRYTSGTVVLVQARCRQGFVGWSGDVPSIVDLFSNPLAVEMDRPRSLVALCSGAVPTATPSPVRAPTATPKPTPTPAPTRTPTPTPTPAPTLAPTLGGLGFGNVITVRYS
jgi:serine/threonine protein kinase